MIIDVHTHILKPEWCRKWYLEYKSPLLKMYTEDWKVRIETTPEIIIKDMDEAGIEKTVIHWPDMAGLISNVSINKRNDLVAEYANKYPDRLIGFGSVYPPKGEEALLEMERCVKDLGLKGIKVYPPSGFYPDDKDIAYPCYEKAAALGVPVMIHLGGYPYPKQREKYARPICLDDVATDFPELKIIGCHMGVPGTEELAWVMLKNPNVYCDISGSGQILLKLLPMDFVQKLAMLIALTPNQILFGTDWPWFRTFMSNKEFVSAIKEFKVPKPLKEAGVRDFTEEEKQKILGDNAARFFGL